MNTHLIQTLTRALQPMTGIEKPQEAGFGIALSPADIEILKGPEAFRERLLAMIATATRRITLVGLYLQDDTAGREILEALHAAKQARPELAISVLVDWHRAKRSRIGEKNKHCNRDFYREMTLSHPTHVPIYGVPIQTRELFGVFHLKGFIIDDHVIYSGASINDVYLARHDKYRLDRYHVIHSHALAQSMDKFVESHLLESPAVIRLDTDENLKGRRFQLAVRHLRASLKKAHYRYSNAPSPSPLAVVPVVGLGSRHNALNQSLLSLIQGATQRIVIFTPYFNLPRDLRLAVGKALSKGVEILLVVGDKEANDFFISPGEKFSTIGLLPYLYEGNLRRFARKNQKAMEKGALHIHLWKHEQNTFHVKGLWVDGHTSVSTGNNLNPRAWALDLENALVISDVNGALTAPLSQELTHILEHAPRLIHYKHLPTPKDYPPHVQRLLKRMSRIRMDRLVNIIM